MNKIDLSNRVAIVTGGAQGFGLAIVKRFLQSGAEVIIWDKDEKLLEELKLDHNVHKIVTDVTDYQSVEKSTKESISKCGKIDILVNNAGVVSGGNFLEVPIENHKLTYDVNTQGVINMTYVFLQDLIDRPISHIVNISSASGFTSLPGGTTYASSKAAVTSFSESLFNELKKDGHNHVGMTITCTAYVRTGMFDGVTDPFLIPMLTPEKLAKKIVRAVFQSKMFVLEPAFIKCIPIIKAIFPRFIYDYLGRILGGYNSMDFWEGHSN